MIEIWVSYEICECIVCLAPLAAGITESSLDECIDSPDVGITLAWRCDLACKYRRIDITPHLLVPRKYEKWVKTKVVDIVLLSERQIEQIVEKESATKDWSARERSIKTNECNWKKYQKSVQNTLQNGNKDSAPADVDASNDDAGTSASYTTAPLGKYCW